MKDNSDNRLTLCKPRNKYPKDMICDSCFSYQAVGALDFDMHWTRCFPTLPKEVKNDIHIKTEKCKGEDHFWQGRW